MGSKACHAGLQDSASLATRLEGLEKEMEALKEAHGLEMDRMTAELARTHEVSYCFGQKTFFPTCCLIRIC